MKTRYEKWRHYRKRIENTPDSGFEVEKNISERPQTPEDVLELSKTIRSDNAISLAQYGVKKKKPTLFLAYEKQKRLFLLLKFGLLLLAIVGLILVYFFWVI